MIKTRAAFTMIELVFVIVVIGILASIAIPRLAATRDDAQIAKGRSDVAAIRSAIMNERQGRLLTGQTDFIPTLGTTFQGDGGRVLMTYPPSTGNDNGEWSSEDGLTFTYHVMNSDNTFTYDPDDGSFQCTDGDQCAALTE